MTPSDLVSKDCDTLDSVLSTCASGLTVTCSCSLADELKVVGDINVQGSKRRIATMIDDGLASEPKSCLE